MTPPRRRFRCRLCTTETVLTAWIPVQECVDSARLLMHLSQNHRGQIGPYLDRMTTEEDIERILTTELFEALEGRA